MILCFQKVNFRGVNLFIWNFDLPSVFLDTLASLLSSVNSLFYVKNIAF